MFGSYIAFGRHTLVWFHLRLSIGFNNVYEISVYTKCRELPFQSVYPIDVGGRGQLVIGRLWDLQRFKVRANY